MRAGIFTAVSNEYNLTLNHSNRPTLCNGICLTPSELAKVRINTIQRTARTS